ncbi:Gamma-glutamyltranspeptidase [Clostridiaceae bacterium JG1575]|nr:Gamma-glutamyltranspeptidase [Clostridiaceae bacterium JG1575]
MEDANRYRSWSAKLTVFLGFLVFLWIIVPPLRIILTNSQKTADVSQYVNIGSGKATAPVRSVAGVATQGGAPTATTPSSPASGGSLEGPSLYGVSSSNRLAADVAMAVMGQGGNAADAAAAAALVLAVAEPHASGLGGAGTAMVYTPADGKVMQLNYRERATEDPQKAKIGSYSAVPGLAKGLEYLIATYGTAKDEKVLIDPALKLAEEGFQMDTTLYDIWKHYQFKGVLSKPAEDLFFPNGVMKTFIQQPELAKTLRYLKEHGLGSFYREPFASEFAALTTGFTAQDLKNYTMYVEEALHTKFHGWDVYTPSPPLSGITLAQMLQMMDQVKFNELALGSPQYYHMLAQISTIAYHSRYLNIADPLFVPVPTKELLSQAYTQGLVDRIEPGVRINIPEADYKPTPAGARLAPPSGPLAAGTPRVPPDGPSPFMDPRESHTTHLVVVDSEGMTVSMTNTIGTFFGTGEFVKGCFVNDFMKKFNEEPENPNVLAPKKSPRSYTAPTILKKNQAILGIGSPGGARIPSMMAQGLAHHILYGMPLEEAMDHQRFFTDGTVIEVESPLPQNVVDSLTQMGYTIDLREDGLYFGGIQGILWDGQAHILQGVSDARRGGVWRSSLPQDPAKPKP